MSWPFDTEGGVCKGQHFESFKPDREFRSVVLVSESGLKWFMASRSLVDLGRG